MKYVAYGSNMSRQQMAYRCPGAKLLGIGRIYGAQLEFYTHATINCTQNNEHYVPVAVWEISKDHEKQLDRYEGYPVYYNKRPWLVTMTDGSRLLGMIYLMELKRPLPPTKGYFEGIVNAYSDLEIGFEIKKVLQPALERSHQRSKSQF